MVFEFDFVMFSFSVTKEMMNWQMEVRLGIQWEGSR